MRNLLDSEGAKEHVGSWGKTADTNVGCVSICDIWAYGTPSLEERAHSQKRTGPKAKP